MKRNGIRMLIACVVVASLLIVPPVQYGCGPFFPEAIFTYTAHPDLPLRAYARGQLGIVQPTYWRKYLYIAYRNLNGPEFSPAEVRVLTKAKRDEGLGTSAEMANRQTPASTWHETRIQVPNLPLPDYIQKFRSQVSGYRENLWEFYGYDNCLANAYETAAKTLQSRIRQFGAASAEVRSWTEAQDRVFAHCGGWWGIKADTAPLPSQANAADAPLIRADRAYQIAAAQFYSNQFDVSREGFEKIAADESSPWRTIAPLLAARCLIRKSMWTTPEGMSEAETLKLAQARLEKVLLDPKQSEYHKCAQGLLNFVAGRLNPEKRLLDVSANLAQPNIQSTLEQDLADFTFLLDRTEAVDFDYRSGIPYEQQAASASKRKKKAFERLRAGHDLLDWTLTFQASSESAFSHSIERWKKTGSLPWLVAALTKAKAGNPESVELLAVAEKIPANSPAYFTVTFHRLRLLAEKGQADAARTELDTLLAKRKSEVHRSALNLFKALRMRLAQNLDEFLRFAPRVAATTTFNEDGSEPPGRKADFTWGGARTVRWRELLAGKSAFDTDAAIVLSKRIPLHLLQQSVKSDLLPSGERREVAVAAWVKAILLEKDEIAAELSPTLIELAPELKTNLSAYQAEKAPDSRRFAAVFAILHFPGMRPFIGVGIGRDTPFVQIDSYRENWWCTFDQKDDAWYGYRYEQDNALKKPLRFLYPQGEVGFPKFLSAKEKTMAGEEWTRQEALMGAPTHLSKIVIAWAKQHPQDPRVPEALYLAVRSTRYGCADADTSKNSKEAFLILHRKYPKSEWTQKTKYWF